ncbi:MAG: hypothetical protein KI790_12400 [Cyclobacteriaceae bacterium]|nr:hypothetical protein [Cyclobacteriaceae bacterium HetDA_MAG_MS6]
MKNNLLFVFSLLTSGAVYSQTIAEYYQDALENASIYKGTAYEFSYPSTGGHPFLHPYFATGTVKYESFRFEDVLLKYDVVNDLVVISQISEDQGEVPVVLDTRRISAFSIEDRTFRYLRDSTDDLKEGFYEIINSEAPLIIARPGKEKKKAENKPYMYEFQPRIKAWYWTGDSFKRITGKGNLIKAYPDHHQSLKSFWNASRLNWRYDAYQAISKINNRYRQLSGHE